MSSTIKVLGLRRVLRAVFFSGSDLKGFQSLQKLADAFEARMFGSGETDAEQILFSLSFAAFDFYRQVNYPAEFLEVDGYEDMTAFFEGRGAADEASTQRNVEHPSLGCFVGGLDPGVRGAGCFDVDRIAVGPAYLGCLHFLRVGQEEQWIRFSEGGDDLAAKADYPPLVNEADDAGCFLRQVDGLSLVRRVVEDKVLVRFQAAQDSLKFYFMEIRGLHDELEAWLKGFSSNHELLPDFLSRMTTPA